MAKKKQTREELIIEIMAQADKDKEPVTREEAEEMADMEIKANGFKTYEVTEKVKNKKVNTERKVDNDKLEIFNLIIPILADNVENGTLKNEVEYGFAFKGNNYTLKLTKHRPKK